MLTKLNYHGNYGNTVSGRAFKYKNYIYFSQLQDLFHPMYEIDRDYNGFIGMSFIEFIVKENKKLNRKQKC